MDTALFIPGTGASPPAAPRGNHRRTILVFVAVVVGLALLVGLLRLLLYNQSAQEGAVLLGGGVIYLVVAVLLFLLAMLWILFPVFVYFALGRLEKLLAQIERNTRNH